MPAAFAIIIPTLNEANVIERYLIALQPLRLQATLILVDGGSVDDTTHIAKPFVDQIIITHSGRAHQMNIGAQHAKNSILIFLHADTLLPSNALTLIQNTISPLRHWGRFNIQFDNPHLLIRMIAWFMNRRSCLTGIATGDQAIFVTRDTFFKVNQYTEQALMEDIDLSKKLKRFSRPICLNTKVISSARRWEKFGILKTILLMWSLRLRYFFGASPTQLAHCYQQGLFWKR